VEVEAFPSLAQAANYSLKSLFYYFFEHRAEIPTVTDTLHRWASICDDSKGAMRSLYI